MKGSEKQIKWASDIIESINTIFTNMEKLEENHPMSEQVREMHKKIIKNMNESDAADIIDDFKNVERHLNPTDEEVKNDYSELVNIISICEMTKGRKYRDLKELKNEEI